MISLIPIVATLVALVAGESQFRPVRSPSAKPLKLAPKDLVVEMVDELAGFRHEPAFVKYSTGESGKPAAGPHAVKRSSSSSSSPTTVAAISEEEEDIASRMDNELPLLSRVGQAASSFEILSVSPVRLVASLRDTVASMDLETALRTALTGLQVAERHFEAIYAHLESHKDLILEFFNIDLPMLRGVLKEFVAMARGTLGRVADSGLIHSLGNMRAADALPMIQMIRSFMTGGGIGGGGGRNH